LLIAMMSRTRLTISMVASLFASAVAPIHDPVLPRAMALDAMKPLTTPSR
jgi:hypothetical protein